MDGVRAERDILRRAVPQEPRKLASYLIAETVSRGELFVSAARIVFCSIIFVRFVWLGGVWSTTGIPPKAWIETPAIFVAIGFSVWEIVWSRRGHLSIRILHTVGHSRRGSVFLRTFA